VEKLIRKREILNSNKFSKEILSDRLRSQSGLNVIVKQLLRNKLKDLQHESKTEMSPVQRLLVQNDSKENFLDQTVGRSGSFLDRLINVMKEERQNGLTEGLPRKPKFLSLGSSQASNNLLQKSHSKANQFLENIDIETESKIEALKFFEEAGLLSKDNRNLKITEEVNEVHPLVSKVDEPSFQKSFLEEEMTAAELETEYLADEIAKLLVELEADINVEDAMMHRSKDIIQTKLRRFPMHMLLKDRDFIDSVFFRFALMKLPLRTEDIDLSESFEINKVLKKNMAEASKETRSLLEDLRNNDSSDERATDRAKAIDQSRRQLQNLLKIVSRN